MERAAQPVDLGVQPLVDLLANDACDDQVENDRCDHNRRRHEEK